MVMSDVQLSNFQDGFSMLTAVNSHFYGFDSLKIIQLHHDSFNLHTIGINRVYLNQEDVLSLFQSMRESWSLADADGGGRLPPSI